MKKILNLVSVLFLTVISYAQTLTTTENYIYTKNCLSEDCSKKSEAVIYSDVLGRTKQIINIKASPSGKDIVVPVEYDGFGRNVKSYLPIPQTSTQNGAIYTDPKSNASQTYGSDSNYFSSSLPESSPRNWLLSQTTPGTEYAGHSTSFSYTTNSDADVKKYFVQTSWQNGATNDVITVSGNHAVGTLLKNSVTDEDGNISTQFINGKGQTILSRKNNVSQNSDTYYVYNKFNQLVYVIPPLALNEPLSQTTLDNLCYQYKYDSKSRQVEKKLPGKGWEYMVYDKADQLIMTQDANMRIGSKWLITKHDQFGRVIYTGILPGGSRESMQGQAGGLVITESKHITGFTRNGMQIYYSNGYFFDIETVLTVNYYDTYPTGSPTIPTQVLGKATIGDNMGDAVNTKNLPTATYVKNIENDSWTKNYLWYDNKARAVGTYTINHLGGYTKTETEMDFAGVPLQTKVYHKRISADAENIISQTFEYDSQNRLKKHWHQVNGNPQELLSENTYDDLSQLTNKKVGNNLQSIDYTYNIRGSITKVNNPVNQGSKLFGYELKYYQPASTATGKSTGNIAEIEWRTASDQVLRKYNYQYDALNRMTAGIYSEPNSFVPPNDFYSEYVSYDMNSNILSLQRNTKGVSGTASQMDNLTYAYADNGKSNRLNSVTDSSTNYSGYPDTSGNAISYDDNGNMKDYKDKGILQIDYNFLNLPKFIKFNQAIPSRGGARYVNTAFTYNAVGTKLKKVYQYVDGANLYLASKTTDYLDGFLYESDATLANPMPATVLKFVPTAEGYYNFENNKYIYNYTDHLGNIRLSYFKNSNGSAEVLEENNFYPFGLKHEGYNAQSGNPSYNYQFGGKELQKETGWNDFGARMYMSDIARWGVVDPMAEATPHLSTYNYALNNPIMFIDPDGRKAIMSDVQFEGGGIADGGFASYFAGGGSGGAANLNSFLGNTGSGWGTGGNGFSTFGQTPAYAALMSGQTSSISNVNGYLNWNTLDRANTNGMLNDGSIGGMTAHSIKLAGDANWYGPSGQANWLFGATAALGGVKGVLNSERMYGEGVRRGLAGNYILTGRNLSQFRTAPMTEATIPISSVGKLAGIAGVASFGIAVVLDYKAYSNGQISKEKFILNSTIGVYGLTGVGTVPAILYFGIDAFYPGGWEQAAIDQDRLYRENKAINPNWQMYPGAMKQ